MKEQQKEPTRICQPTDLKDDSGLKLIKAVSILSGTGIYLACVVAICILIGMKFDEWFLTAPYGRLAGILLGFPLGLYSIYRQIKQHGLI